MVKTRMAISNYFANIKCLSLDSVNSGVANVGLASSFYKTTYDQKLRSLCFSFSCAQPCLTNNSKRMSWSIRSSIDDSSFTSSASNENIGRTRLIKVIQDLLTKLGAKIQKVRKNLPMKLIFFLIGFYCATAFATVIGQTGDWDILSAGLAVAVVEGIGALMYRASLPLTCKGRSLISMCNYWKAGLTLGLFLDSFKY
ncbi:hypothetical protein QN277_029261 [Acacia crassicarpa]|uniref:Ycf20-like protein n=2 Tax=Acacia crassicarpa TaxID=499986 RepID=A0AAE1J975_9FABA|nr:hypothetical protein QN277_029261 [Acacia crassicarpa]